MEIQHGRRTAYDKDQQMTPMTRAQKWTAGLIVRIVVLLLRTLVIPRRAHYRDGSTVEYQSPVYSYVEWYCLGESSTMGVVKILFLFSDN